MLIKWDEDQVVLVHILMYLPFYKPQLLVLYSLTQILPCACNGFAHPMFSHFLIFIIILLKKSKARFTFYCSDILFKLK